MPRYALQARGRHGMRPPRQRLLILLVGGVVGAVLVQVRHGEEDNRYAERQLVKAREDIEREAVGIFLVGARHVRRDRLVAGVAVKHVAIFVQQDEAGRAVEDEARPIRHRRVVEGVGRDTERIPRLRRPAAVLGPVAQHQQVVGDRLGGIAFLVEPRIGHGDVFEEPKRCRGGDDRVAARHEGEGLVLLHA